jgi:hypothetical protein
MELLERRFPGYETTLLVADPDSPTICITDFPVPGVNASIWGRRIDFRFRTFDILQIEEFGKTFRERVAQPSIRVFLDTHKISLILEQGHIDHREGAVSEKQLALVMCWLLARCREAMESVICERLVNKG